jgi:hypothetical protein
MNLSLNRQVFDKKKFEETVDTNFTQLVQPPDPTFFDLNLATIEDFFTLYNKFFFEIPKEGEVNSHTYLIKESSDYVGFDSNSEEIQALLNEIATLRQENLQLRQEQLDLINSIGNRNQTPELIRNPNAIGNVDVNTLTLSRTPVTSNPLRNITTR